MNAQTYAEVNRPWLSLLGSRRVQNERTCTVSLNVASSFDSSLRVYSAPPSSSEPSSTRRMWRSSYTHDLEGSAASFLCTPVVVRDVVNKDLEGSAALACHLGTKTAADLRLLHVVRGAIPPPQALAGHLVVCHGHARRSSLKG